MQEDNDIKIQKKSDTDELKERVKELNCLYGISAIVHDMSMPLKDAMQRIVELISQAMFHSDISAARIAIDGLEFKTDDFEETPWILESPIKVEDNKIGVLQVVYKEGRPDIDDGPFLNDEKRLLNAITDLISRHMYERGIKGEFLKQETMEKAGSPEKEPEKGEWEVILDLLMKTDPRTLLRITRKMVYHLYRSHNKEITNLMQSVCPIERGPGVPQWCGINMPNPRQDVESLRRIQQGVFEIAKESLPAEEISDLFRRWLREDKARPLLLASQKTGIPLVEITDELNRFYESYGGEKSLAYEDSMAIRTSLINRFFSDRIKFINIAKKYITPDDFVPLLKKVVGPAQGAGRLGGKSSGIFLAQKIIEDELAAKENGIAFARSWYLTSDTMMDLIQYNDMDDMVHLKYLDPKEIQQELPILEQLFKNAVFSAEILEGLRRIIRDLEGSPIIVRSSSLLEDSFGAAFSGKYKSLFIANIGSEEERLNSLMDAIAEVYASTLAPDPIEYRRERGLLDVNEQMGILIQEVVGNQIGPYYIPAYAGVSFNRNEFQWSPRIRREDGIVRLVAGLGTRAVDRIGNDYPILVSPKRPELRVNTLVEERVKYSQRYMDVINIETGVLETIEASEIFRKYSDEYPKVNDIVSIYSDGQLTTPSVLTDMEKSDIIITFDKLLDKRDFIPQMRWMMDLLEEKLGIPVDLEFASDGEKLYVLQCRPQSQSREMERKPIPENTPQDRKIFTANRYVTTGNIENIEYVVYVDPKGYESLESREEMYKIAKVVGELNSKLPERRFILMGPGRWGSRGDIKLGVPIIYRDINNTSLLVEIAREKGSYVPELSFGTHFFQDLVEADIKYLPLYPDEEKNVFNERFFDKSPNCLSKLLPERADLEDIIKVIKIPDIYGGGTMSVVMDGDKNEGLAYVKPPDHWEWRLEKVNEIAEELDAKTYGIESLYLLGSTKDCTAGPCSDIDLLVHFTGTPEKKDRLMFWFKEKDKELVDENEERTGRRTSNLLDVHIVTDEDIEEKTSWACHIDNPYGGAREIPLD